MGMWTNLVVLSVVAVSALSLPRPDEYDIPEVGNNRRSQYYVLHDDGSHKYGYDTGDHAFESQKSSSPGQVSGQFGYRDPDGHDIRLQYTSGHGGFVAQGDHIPKVHPDVEAAFASARARQPFVDPLAGAGGDRSYNFDFAGDEHSRSEVSDSDGTVRGSYSYVDESGRTRSYNYRAGQGIGFEIEGDDIPHPVQPLATHTTSGQAGFASQSFNERKPTSRTASAPSRTYFPPTPTATSSQASTSFTASPKPIRPSTSRTSSRTSSSTRPFETANTRTSQSPSGSYSLAYETSSHSRQESGDDNNNVRGKFSFVADDDGVDRSVTYEAGSATGFIAEGAHLPVGPIVPGAPTGQVTGRIVPVVQTPFIDPLANSNMDASYNFGFDSETYSRSESADEDGNVSGTYSVLGEDNILRTHRFRAGKGIGFETEEISAVPGQRRATAAAPTSSRQPTTFSHASSTHTSAPALISTSYLPPHSSRASSVQASHSSRSASKLGSSSSSTAGLKTSQSSEVFPGFTLRQYDPSEGRGKYGYVLNFDD